MWKDSSVFYHISRVMHSALKVNKSNANVGKYAQRVNLRGKKVTIGSLKGFYLVYKATQQCLVSDLDL